MSVKTYDFYDVNDNDVQKQIEELQHKVASYSKRVEGLKDLPEIEFTLEELKEQKKLVDAKLKFQRRETAEKNETMKKVEVGRFLDSLSIQDEDLKALLYSLDDERHDYRYTVITSEGVSENYQTQFELAQRVFGKINKLKKAFGIKDGEDLDDIEGDDTMEIKQDGETYSLDGLNLDKKVKAYAKKHKCSYDVAFYKVTDKE